MAEKGMGTVFRIGNKRNRTEHTQGTTQDNSKCVCHDKKGNCLTEC